MKMGLCDFFSIFAERDEDDEDDDDFIKLSGLLGRGPLCGYEYKSHTAADGTLLLAVLEVLSIDYIYILAL